MAGSARTGEDPDHQEIHLIEADDGWVAKDIHTGVASQGESRAEALAMLDEAVALHTGEAGEPIEDEAAFMREIGIDPESVEPTNDLPDFLS